MTEDQRMMAVTMLANAIRKGERTRRPATAEADPAGSVPDMARLAGVRGRASAAQQYVRGMVDLLAVLFEGGRPAAEGCYEEARRVALGTQVPGADRADLN
jgi:hypothetical protein